MSTTKKSNQTEKTNCINYESSICGILNCETCGMNPEAPESKPITLESKNIVIRKFSDIGETFKGLFIEIIPNPFDAKENDFLKFKDISTGEIIHIGVTKDLERITKEYAGKIISITLTEIIKLDKGQTFKRFIITIY